MKIYFETETEKDEKPVFVEFFDDGESAFLSIGTLAEFENEKENTVVLSYETLSALGLVLSGNYPPNKQIA